MLHEVSEAIKVGISNSDPTIFVALVGHPIKIDWYLVIAVHVANILDIRPKVLIKLVGLIDNVVRHIMVVGPREDPDWLVFQVGEIIDCAFRLSCLLDERFDSADIQWFRSLDAAG